MTKLEELATKLDRIALTRVVLRAREFHGRYGPPQKEIILLATSPGSPWQYSGTMIQLTLKKGRSDQPNGIDSELYKEEDRMGRMLELCDSWLDVTPWLSPKEVVICRQYPSWEYYLVDDHDVSFFRLIERITGYLFYESRDERRGDRVQRIMAKTLLGRTEAFLDEQEKALANILQTREQELAL